ncbi:hypothetical protein [Desulforhopalus singaporensis]|uniref:P-type conjugative transfer protein TrbJ n=1 Tax=Desulforhopalus singaporensis TaxID=91360 RepID=A0A1H0PAB8_9BACT|nr:hypothetical protein [Desulforhopalus singaporensis]SDP02067.1 P-type conjugative transfer protein TrbJ [Desulforhopalus singaporensis]
MKKIIITTTLAVSIMFGPQNSSALFCSNCSTVFTQLFQYVEDIESVVQLTKQYYLQQQQYEQSLNDYIEFIKQTTEMIEQTKQLTNQTDNMIQNTINLPGHLKDRVIIESKYLLKALGKLKSFKADQEVLQEIYTETFPGLEEIKIEGLPVEERIAIYDEQYKNATLKIDDVLKSSFGLSGEQLEQLEQTGEFDAYLRDLLSEKEGNLDAIEAGNQVMGLIAQELRDQRALTATYYQAQSAWNAQERQGKKNQQKELENWFIEEVEISDILMQPGS